MKKILSILILSVISISGCRPRNSVDSEVQKPKNANSDTIQLPFLVVKNSTTFKMLGTPALTRALKTGLTLDDPKNFLCLLQQNTRLSLMEKMTKQLFHKRGKLTVRHYLVKIGKIENTSMTTTASQQVDKLLSQKTKKNLPPCTQQSLPMVGYIESKDILINGVADNQVAYDVDLGKKYAAQALKLGSDEKGCFQPLTGDCWRDVSYAIPRAAGQPDSIFPNIKNDAGKTMNVQSNGPALLAWAKASPERLCELFGLEISPENSLAEAPIGSTLIYRYSDKTNFDEKKKPVCTFSEAHGHIEIRVTKEGKNSVFCSDGCWAWAKGLGGVRAKCSSATAVLYPSLRCPIPASKPK